MSDYKVTKGTASGGKTNKLAPRQRVKDMFMQYKNEIAMALPKYVDPDRLIRVALTALNKNPKLFNATPSSLLGALIQSAQVNLDVGDALGYAYLVPFNKGIKTQDGWTQELQVQFIIGYRGLMELARRTGKVKDIVSNFVVARDDFDYEYGTNHFLKHKPTIFNEADVKAEDITHFYAYAHTTDGGFQFVVMPKYQVDAVMCDVWRKNNPKRKHLVNDEIMTLIDGVWKYHYPSMGMKTAVRQLCKWLPMTQEDHALKIGLENAQASDMGRAAVYELDKLDPDLKELPLATDYDENIDDTDAADKAIQAGAGKVVDEEKEDGGDKKPAAKKKTSAKKSGKKDDDPSGTEPVSLKDEILEAINAAEDEDSFNDVISEYRDKFPDLKDVEYQEVKKALSVKEEELSGD